MPKSSPPPTIDHIIGLDLGQSADPTALSVIERTTPADGMYALAVRYLKRWPLGTGYPAILADIEALVNYSNGPGEPPMLDNVLMAVDQTGVGRGVIDFFRLSERLRVRMIPITITGGYATTRAPDGWHVPKKELVSAVQVLLQARRLAISAELPEAKMLVKELLNFKMKITLAANEVFGAWREGLHDDLVLSVALPAWVMRRGPASIKSKPIMRPFGRPPALTTGSGGQGIGNIGAP